ncbi:exonuclease SbcCD subunit D [Enterococcus dongliensis]|uniref:Nuclease SbcCD subunit D n=1 Tax=Enterococcus dongliensis TaxID=2559925 RepID=A0AAW8TLB8_9ENTE|nr:exonuclease SbcCD subunit D [Enterococcus dongliensis]MDT2634816.1 exonuclease SbcCD subunit D [Enterococcus dongliensis]MDT2637887.1 exonuclease SbcCD subunit D [Enterococcus dongliensis]MDT2642875.1 exonuclease SbcCD subunit D [Enterococcus dongliensis]
MKVLHTADWHIGKKLHGYDLLSDQAYILDQILKIAKTEAVDAIMIAGDLYDRSVPSEDSVRLLNQTIAKWNLTEGFPLLVISGNHDSATRLATGAPWFNQTNFYLRTRLEDAFVPIELEDTQFFLLPYFEPVDARIYFEDPDLRTIQAAMPKVIKKIQENFAPNKNHILISHFFVADSSKTESETKIEVGGLDGINGDLLTDFDYVALGHLHGKDALKLANARYSGSPLKYSLSEKNQAKGVWIVDTETQDFSFFELTPLHELTELQASFSELLDPDFYETINRKDYLSILLDDRAIIPNLMNQLRQVYPRIIQVERTNGFETTVVTRLQDENIKEKSPIALTEDFFTAVSQSNLTMQQKNWIETGLHEILQKGGVR